MTPSSRIPLVLALLAVPLAAQSTAQLKKELRKMERAAKKDPAALFEAGKWAKENGFTSDAKRILNKVLKLDPDHEGANLALGNEKFDGKWLPAKQARKLREQAEKAEYEAKGYKKVDGVWVPPDEVADAHNGVFHHDGEVVTRDEKLALMHGKVRHPETGLLIDAKDLQKAKDGYFPLGKGKWGDLAEADKFHSEMSRPWVIRTDHATIISTLPLAQIQNLKNYANQGHEKVAPLFGNREPSPAKRPVIIIAKTQSEYREYGQALGDGTDVAGAFLTRLDAEFHLGGQGVVRPAICDNEKNWGPRYVRHAAALAYVNAIAEDAGADLPLWFVHGIGSYTSRFENDSDAGWFGKQNLARGGVGNVKAFFNSFDLNGDMQSTEIAYELFRAGLMVSFATHGGDQACTDAMRAVTDALSGKSKKSATKAIEKLEKALAAAQDKIVEYLNKLIAKAPR
ncbi:MAG TPA: hypothetical protein ENI87_00710 [bacterium]|nr:hypothetical protein [bacterium]